MCGHALVLAVLAAPLIAKPDEAALVTVTPRETDDILANPHMGWETFHVAADRDPSLPEWIPSTVYYLRWGWRDVEPRAGELNVAFIDGALAAARQAGQRLAFRVMCCSSSPGSPYHPEWLRDGGGRVVGTSFDGVALDVPDLDDPTTLERHLALVRRIAERYDGHPDLDHVDLGSVGWWGEWHMSGGGPVQMPKPETCRRVVDTYVQSFRHTPLLMLIGGGEQTGYACSQGAGWRADCLGDLGGFSRNWCHMRKGYPQWFREAGLGEVWKRSPIAYESCWDMRRWVEEGWSLRYIFNYALATHASYLNNKSVPLPTADDVRPEVERFLKRLGYRLVLRELTQPATARSGQTITLTSRWQNVGSAPCYRPYVVAWRLRAGAKTVSHIGKTAANGWLPGAVDLFTEEFLQSPPDLPPGPVNEVTEEFPLPDDLPTGDYGLAVAIVDPDTGSPAVRLAIEGRAEDGWYPVSRLRVTAE